jgi:hypothetical protein
MLKVSPVSAYDTLALALCRQGRLAAATVDAQATSTELKAAHHLYVEVGADGHAKRLAEELSLRSLTTQQTNNHQE